MAEERSRDNPAGNSDAAGTAHDLNNLFQVIMGSLELIKRSRGEVPTGTLETALRATREAALLARRLLTSLKRPAEDSLRARPGETVLLVEDNGDVRRWAAAALEGLGYRVLQAADAAAALEILEASGRIDLLFTDVLLSGSMTGRELAEAVTARRAGVPVLFTTGYPRDEASTRADVDLEKPYDLERLALTVRGAIDAARGPAA